MEEILKQVSAHRHGGTIIRMQYVQRDKVGDEDRDKEGDRDDSNNGDGDKEDNNNGDNSIT